MSKLPLVELTIAPGVMTEETDRMAKGRWKDSDRIRFRQLLPEKLGGWILASIGTEPEEVGAIIDLETAQHTGLGATFIATATTITLESAVTCDDGDPVWLFGTSITGTFGTRTISDVTAVAGAFKFDLDGAITAALGDSLMIRYPDEFTGGVAITAGGTAGSNSVTIGTGVTTYLRAGTVVRIDTTGGVFFTTLSATISGGAMVLPLTERLPAAATGGTPLRMYAAESDIVDTTLNTSYVLRFLAEGPVASVTMRLTEALPEDADGLAVQVAPFEAVTCDGDQVSTTSLAITPATTIANADGLAFDDSIVMLPAFEQTQICFEGFSRGLHDWVDLQDQQWLAIGTDEKLYVVNNSVLFDITPLRESGTLASPFDTVLDDQTVTVNDAAHGTSVGDYVRFSGASTVGGLDLNDEFQVATVIDADSYTIEADFPATATVVGGGGAVSYEYDIAIGASGNVTVSGWGTGAYGQGFYGIGEAGVGIVQQLRIWSLDNFGEDLLASPNGGSLYHWDRTNGPTTRAVRVDTAPATIERMLVSPQARHVIAYGAGTGSAASPGDPDKLFIRWCSSEDFTVWVPSTVNTAGDLRLDVGSRILTAVESRGDMIVNTDESLHAMQYIAGDFVFALRHLGQSVAIIGPNASVDANGIVMFMGEDDFLMYDGVLRVMPCDVRNQVFDDLNSAQGDKVFASVNKLFTEVWWFYPDSGSETNTRYVKYNYKDQVWDFGTIERTAFHDSSAFLAQKPYGTFDGKLFQHETGVDETDVNGVLQPQTAFLESWDIEIDENGNRLMHIGEMIPDFKTLVGSIDLSLNGHGYPQRASATSTGPFTITSSTEKQDMRIRTRQLAFRVESNALGDDWRMSAWRAGARPHGRRGG